MLRAAYLVIGAGILAMLAVLVWLWLPDPPREKRPDPREVRVAAAADLNFALMDVIEAYRKLHPDTAVTMTPGASGVLFAQIVNKAPFDIFLAADVEYPRKLIEQGVAEKNSDFLYAVGHLVIWVPKASPLDVEKTGIDTLLDPRVKKIAIANPRHAPYGRAAEAALKSLDVYDRVQDKLKFSENVGLAAQVAHRGLVDAAILPVSMVTAAVFRNQGRYWDVPEKAHPRLLQGGVILPWAKDRQATESFRDFLLSPDGQAILKRFGFTPPKE
jgi:molybdate transport system substrate-binding protein